MAEDTLSAGELLSTVEDETLSAIEDETLSAIEDESLSAIEDETLLAIEDETLSATEYDASNNPVDFVTEPNESSTEEGELFYIVCVYIYFVGIKKRVICSLHKLLMLAGGVCGEKNCGNKHIVDYKTSGCCLIIFGTCENGHPFCWESSDVLCSKDQRKLY